MSLKFSRGGDGAANGKARRFMPSGLGEGERKKREGFNYGVFSYGYGAVSLAVSRDRWPMSDRWIRRSVFGCCSRSPVTPI